MFKVIADKFEDTGFIILPEDVANKYFNEGEFLFSSDSYTNCQIFVADKLVEERIDAQNDYELNALENQTYEG